MLHFQAMSTQKVKVFILFLFLTFTIFLSIFYLEKIKASELQIVFLDVGQGSGTLIETAEGKKIIIDTGKEKKALKNLTRELGFFTTKVDFLMLTHYDLDHAGNIPNILNKYKIRTFFDSGLKAENAEESSILVEIFKILEQKKIERKVLSSKDKIYLDKDTSLEILFPSKNMDIESLKSNNSSLVIQIIHKGQKVLITGDLEAKFEKYLVEKFGQKLKSDILLAGHHGSKTSNSKEFLKAVSPEYLVIQSGEENPYGHPHYLVLERARALDIRVIRTDQKGNIIFTFSQKEQKLILKQTEKS